VVLAVGQRAAQVSLSRGGFSERSAHQRLPVRQVPGAGRQG
jgi:hypothetical protein